MSIPVRKGTTSTRRDFYMMISLLTMIGALIFRIPLGRLIGDKGIAYFSPANEIYLAIAGTVSYGLAEATAALVRYRVRREQFRSAGKILKGALFLGGGIGLAFSLFFGIMGQYLMGKIFHVPLAGMAVSLMAPSIFFFIMTGVFRGYFQGNGSKIPAMHSQILHILFLFAGGLIGATLLHGYGVKVSAFLQNADYAGAYGAMGASIGLLAASIFCFLHAVILFFVFRQNAKKQAGRELQRNQEMQFHAVHMLIGTGIFHALYWLCFQGMPLLDQYLFFNFGKDIDNITGQWGQYYGRCLVILGIIWGILAMICLLPVRRIIISQERGENRVAGEKLGILIHQCAIVTIPAAVLLAVLAENILDMLFLGNYRQTVHVLQIGSLGIVFYVFASVFVELLIKSRKIKLVTGIGMAAFILHGGITVLLLETVKIGILAVVIAVIVFYASVAILGFLLVSRNFQYRQEWIKSFAVTIIAAALSGVAAMLLNKVLAPALGMTISMLICILAAVIIYLVLLIVLRAFRNEELDEMAGGRLLIMLAELLHFS